MYDVPHGAGLAVVYPAWMNWHLPMNPTRYEQFARNVFDLQQRKQASRRQPTGLLVSVLRSN
ncbi:iron-containing alcohol dehydrogenase [Paenibacillus ottowii]|uniref:Iron-containing alcohol dehydrogenase n=1 Tax=Paenibacillus ottowii TaxID=2315729 RepID=A0ABY3B960_9BACL|nr:iron-containing alcohol dehydrogenase [Paenibacillus ottowii]